MTQQASVTVIGEAIVDLIPAGAPRTSHAVPGGGPYNVAVGLARLGHRASLMARLADTAFGRILREHAQPKASTWTPRRAPRSQPRWPWYPWTPRPGPATTSTSTGRRTGSGAPRRPAGPP